MVARLVLVLCLGVAFAFLANASGGKDFMRKAGPAHGPAIMTVAIATERPAAHDAAPATQPSSKPAHTSYERLMAWLAD